MTPNQKLEIIKQTRKIASDTLTKVLKQVLESDNQISEFEFCNIWLEELRKHSEILPEGWYTPPPHGISALFSIPQNSNRTNFRSLRQEEFWPKIIFTWIEKKELPLYIFLQLINSFI